MTTLALTALAAGSCFAAGFVFGLVRGLVVGGGRWTR